MPVREHTPTNRAARDSPQPDPIAPLELVSTVLTPITARRWGTVTKLSRRRPSSPPTCRLPQACHKSTRRTQTPRPHRLRPQRLTGWPTHVIRNPGKTSAGTSTLRSPPLLSRLDGNGHHHWGGPVRTFDQLHRLQRIRSRRGHHQITDLTTTQVEGVL